VKAFAQERVKPLVQKMDEEAKMPRELVKECFDLGIMGIEIPTTRAAPAPRSSCRSWRSRAGQVDASVAVLGRRAEHAVQTTRSCAGARPAQQKKYFPRLAAEWVGAYALSEAAPAPTLSRWPAGPTTRATTTS